MAPVLRLVPALLALAALGSGMPAFAAEAPTDPAVTRPVETRDPNPTWTPEEIQRAQNKLALAHGIYGAGVVMYIGGGVGVGVGAVTCVVGIFPAALGDEKILTTGVYILVGGFGVAALGLPVTTTGAMLGAAALRGVDIPVSMVAGWVSVGGLVVAVAGLPLLRGELLLLGAGTAVVAGGVQTVVSSRAMRTFRRNHDLALALTPMVSRDVQGLALSGRF